MSRVQVSPPSQQKITTKDEDGKQLVSGENAKFEHTFEPQCGLCPNCLPGPKVLITDHRLEVSGKGINSPIACLNNPILASCCYGAGWLFYGSYSNTYDLKEVNKVGIFEPSCCCLGTSIGVSLKGQVGGGLVFGSTDKAAMNKMKATLVQYKLMGLGKSS